MEYSPSPPKQRLPQEPTCPSRRANGREELQGNRCPKKLSTLEEAEIDWRPDLSCLDFPDQLFPGQDLAKALNGQGNVQYPPQRPQTFPHSVEAKVEEQVRNSHGPDLPAFPCDPGG